MPWLEPDISDAMRADAASSARQVEHMIVVPIGFISDHMEVLQDLDTDAAATADSLGVGFSRVGTPHGDPRFSAMIVSLVKERMMGETPVALGDLGLVPTQCSATCCPPSKRPSRPAQS